MTRFPYQAEPEISGPRRDRLLKIASDFAADRTVPESVLLAAAPLLAWMEEAGDKADMDARFAALNRHYSNVDEARFKGDLPEWPTTEDFLTAVRKLHGFLYVPHA